MYELSAAGLKHISGNLIMEVSPTPSEGDVDGVEASVLFLQDVFIDLDV